MGQCAISLQTKQANSVVPIDPQDGHFDAVLTAEEIESESLIVVMSPMTTESLIPAFNDAGCPIVLEQNGQVTQFSSTLLPHSRQ